MHTQEYKATKKQIVRLQCVCVFVCVCVWGRLKLDVQRQGGGIILDVDGERGWGMDNFHGRHMCIIPFPKPQGIIHML